MKKVIYPILFLSLLAACTVPVRKPETTPPPSANPTSVASATVPIAPPPETIAAPTRILNPTATPDHRLPPERWREWPVIPLATERAIQIYRAGQGMGLDEHAFSKVGDCQSIKEAFMGYFDIPERYSLGQDYAYLQKTVDAFAGHFNTDGQAVRGGFNAAAVLSPLWADPKVCLAGENPLECELRVTKPIIVFVSLEVWWEGRTPQQYETLMRRILDTIISNGAVPILATKADNVEGDNSLNLTTARLAYEYDLPLWNFWAAVQALPAHGMDTNRNDGFHISTDAWSTRSFTGLEALDSVWRGLTKTAPTNVAIPAVSLTVTPGMIETSVQNVTTPLIPMEGTNTPSGPKQIVFGLSQRQGEGYVFPGVYLLDLNTRHTRQIFGLGVRFQSASPDGKYLLVSEGSALYRTDLEGTDPVRLAANLYPFGNTDAVWLPDGRIAAVLTKPEGTHISILSTDGIVISELPASNILPVEIYRTSNASHIYWESGSCSSPGICQREDTWVTSPDGKLHQALMGFSDPVLAPDGDLLAAEGTSTEAQNILAFTNLEDNSIRSYPLPGDILVDFAWSPAGEALAAVVAMRSDYSGKVSGNRNFLITPHTFTINEFPQSTLLNPRVLWSPDGEFLLWIGTIPGENGYKVSGNLVDLASRQVSDLDTAIDQSSPDYLAVTNADWLALP